MSPKNLVVFLLVGLCATQMVSAHREARSLANMMSSAKSKLNGMLGMAQDAASSSVETVWNYINRLESKVLDAGTSQLAKAGIDIDLNDIADLFKSNIKICASDDEVKAEAKAILVNVASCVTKDVTNLKNLIGDMQDLWSTAKSLPSTMQDVAKQCRAHSDTDVTVDVLNTPVDTAVAAADASHDLAEESSELLEAASHHLSKHALWSLERTMHCVQSVYTMTKNDILTIPGEMISTASEALKLTKSAQGGIPACVGAKLAASSGNIGKLALKVGSCVAAGVSEGEDVEEVIKNNPALASLRKLSGAAKTLAGAAEKLEELQNSPVVAGATAVANLIG